MPTTRTAEAPRGPWLAAIAFAWFAASAQANSTLSWRDQLHDDTGRAIKFEPGQFVVYNTNTSSLADANGSPTFTYRVQNPYAATLGTWPPLNQAVPLPPSEHQVSNSTPSIRQPLRHWCAMACLSQGRGRLFFQHMRKAGGTTIRKWLQV